MSKKTIRITKKIIAFLILATAIFICREPILDIYYKFEADTSEEYKQNKDLIRPYFDEKFYLNHYAERVKALGLTAIDHYLQHGWRGEWQTHTDPNAWFNTTLYKVAF